MSRTGSRSTSAATMTCSPPSARIRTTSRERCWRWRSASTAPGRAAGSKSRATSCASAWRAPESRARIRAADHLRSGRPVVADPLRRPPLDVVARIEAAASRWNVLEHPFYQRWSAGELTRHELAEYAAQYRHAVVALADAAAAAGDAEHAREEREHIALWDAFAEGCGSIPADANAETLDCTTAWTAGDDRLERLAVLYAIESAQPAISTTKLEGLVGHYGFEEGPATEYFSLHAERDHDHAAHSKELLQKLATEEDAPRLAARAEAAARGNWRLLDGIPT